MIVIVDGFDMVGKDLFIKEVYPNCQMYHPSHNLTDATIGRHQSWVIGHSIVEFLEQVSKIAITENIVINRGITSSIVYSRIYGNKEIPSQVIDWYLNNDFFKNRIKHIYIKHKNEKTAKLIYDLSKKREVPDNQISRKFDQFNSFEFYWRMYSIAHLKFLEAYESVGVKPEIWISDPTDEWVNPTFSVVSHFYKEGEEPV